MDSDNTIFDVHLVNDTVLEKVLLQLETYCDKKNGDKPQPSTIPTLILPTLRSLYWDLSSVSRSVNLRYAGTNVPARTAVRKVESEIKIFETGGHARQFAHIRKKGLWQKMNFIFIQRK